MQSVLARDDCDMANSYPRCHAVSRAARSEVSLAKVSLAKSSVTATALGLRWPVPCNRLSLSTSTELAMDASSCRSELATAAGKFTTFMYLYAMM